MSEPESPDTNLPSPHQIALKRFEPLIGKWELKGRTLDAQEDNITGWTTVEWLLGGYFLKLEGGITFEGSAMQSLEIIAYDPESQRFPATVYSDMSGIVHPYEWEVQDNVVIHSGLGATYRGTFSADGNTLTGGWRPDEGTSLGEGVAYDAVMTRLH